MEYILSASCAYDQRVSQLRIPLYEILPNSEQEGVADQLEQSENTELFERGWYHHWEVSGEGSLYRIWEIRANGRLIPSLWEASQPFLMQFGFVQFHVVIEHGAERLPLVSKYCSAMNSEDGENIREMLKQILKIGESGLRELLEWPSSTPEEDQKKIKSEQEQYSMLNGVLTFGSDQTSAGESVIRKIQETYERHGGYFLTRPAFTVKKKPIPVQFHQVKQLNRDSMVWSIQNGQMQEVPTADKGVFVRNRRYVPIRTLSETANRDYCIYENRVVVGFLKTMLRSLSQERSVAELRQFNMVKLLLNIEDEPENQKRDERLETLQKQYQRYLHLENRQIPNITRLPRQTKRFLEIQPYRDIYQCISMWFRNQSTLEFGSGAIFKGKLADVIYEYFCWMQLLQMFEEHGWQKSAVSERITYDWDDSQKTAPQFSNIVYLKKEKYPQITLYFEPRIPPMRRRPADDHGLSLFRITDSFYGWTPDYVIKVGDGGSAQYAVFDAKFRPMDQLFAKYKPSDTDLCAMEEALYKYYMEVAGCDMNRPIKMVWLLQGRHEQNAETWVENNSDSDHLSCMTSCMLGKLSWGAVSLNSVNADQWRENFWEKFERIML